MDYAVNKEKVIMALTLDKVRRCERIVIGVEYQVRRRLAGSGDSEVLYDCERPLGELLFDHEKQLDKDWNADVIYPLRRALLSPLGRKENEAVARGFLDNKEEFQDPICIYTSYQCRRWYAENRTVFGDDRCSDQFENRIMGLTRSFKQILWDADKNYSVDQVMERLETYTKIDGVEKDVQARIWYPGRRRNIECLIVEDSYAPVIWYYLNHLWDWGFCFCRCNNCGKIFLVSSKHHGLCSDACRKEKNRQNKREFDARARENKYDIDYNNTSQHMRNRLNNIRKGEGV